MDILLIPAVVNGTQGLFWLDTGASRTVVSAEFARRIGVDEAAMYMPISGTLKAQLAQLVPIESLQIGPVDFGGFRAIMVDMRHINAYARADVVGMIGRDILGRVRSTIDCPGGRFSIGQPLRSEPEHVIPMAVSEQGWFVQGAIGDRPVTFMLDTGCSPTVVREQHAKRLSTAVLAERTVNVPLADINRARDDASHRVLTVRGLRVGNRQRSPFDVVVGEASLLGFSFLKHYTVTLDPAQKFLLVE